MRSKARALLARLEGKVEYPVITPAAAGDVLPGSELGAELIGNHLALVASLVVQADSQGQAKQEEECGENHHHN